MSILKQKMPSVCPHCGCDVIVKECLKTYYINEEKKLNQHCNGQHWETRHMLCGISFNWIPNFSTFKVDGPCTHDKAYVEGIIKKNAIRDQIAALEKQLEECNKQIYQKTL